MTWVEIKIISKRSNYPGLNKVDTIFEVIALRSFVLSQAHNTTQHTQRNVNTLRYAHRTSQHGHSKLYC